MHPTTLYLVRHGETLANVEQRWYGSLDAPLSPRGEVQVAATGVRFGANAAQAAVDAIFASPLGRAQKTAAAIGQALNLPVIVEPSLREFHIGDWEGRTYRELMEEERLWERWKVDPAFAPPNGESPASFARRTLVEVGALLDQQAGRRLVLVSHGGVIGCLLDAWIGSATGDWARWEPHNCSVSVLHWEDGRWQPGAINDVSHLPDDAKPSYRPVYA
jgi:broad specificity phosphatase PhoE